MGDRRSFPVDETVAIETDLARRFDRRHAVLTNRGTTALAAAFHALDRPAGTRALFPAALCSVPVFAAPFAGWVPLFADVSLSDGNFDVAEVERVLRENAGSVGAVVPVHMFGRADEVESLARLADRAGAALVEDLALALGARREGRPVGSRGRLACLSFVRKIVPLRTGGAVLTDDAELARRAREFVGALPRSLAEGEEEVSAALRAFHAVTGFVAAGGWRRRALLAPWAAEFRRLLLAATGPEDWDAAVVRRELDGLSDLVSARRARAEILDTALSHPRIRPLAHDGSAFFAYAVRLDGIAAEDVLAFSGERGYTFKRIAYPAVPRVFGTDRPFPNAERLEREVVGFPVDERRPVSVFWSDAAEFIEALEAYLAARGSRVPVDERGRLEFRMGGLP